MEEFYDSDSWWEEEERYLEREAELHRALDLEAFFPPDDKNISIQVRRRMGHAQL